MSYHAAASTGALWRVVECCGVLKSDVARYVNMGVESGVLWSVVE